MKWGCPPPYLSFRGAESCNIIVNIQEVSSITTDVDTQSASENPPNLLICKG